MFGAKAAWAGAKTGAKTMHRGASRWAGKYGSDAKLPGKRLADGSPDLDRQVALNRRGSRRMMGAYGAGGVLGLSSMRGSSGSEGIQPRSMGGTTMGGPPQMY